MKEKGTFCVYATLLVVMITALLLGSKLAEIRDHRLFVEGKPTELRISEAGFDEKVTAKRVGKLIVGMVSQGFSGAYSGTNCWTFVKEKGKVHAIEDGVPFATRGGSVAIGPDLRELAIVDYGVARIYRNGRVREVSEATKLTSFDGVTMKGWFSSDAKGRPLRWIDFGEEHTPYRQFFAWSNGRRKLTKREPWRRTGNGFSIQYEVD